MSACGVSRRHRRGCRPGSPSSCKPWVASLPHLYESMGYTACDLVVPEYVQSKFSEAALERTSVSASSMANLPYPLPRWALFNPHVEDPKGARLVSRSLGPDPEHADGRTLVIEDTE